MPKRAKVMLIGFDGATFSVADPLIRSGTMPNLASIINRGSRAILESTVPWHSAAAWTSMVTGVNPGGHGIFNFTRIEPDLRYVPVSSGSVMSDALWDILSRQGLKVGIVNVPVTFPARPVNGFMISGLPLPGAHIYPSNEKTILKFFEEYTNMKIETKNGYYTDPFTIVESKRDQDRARLRAAIRLADYDPDFFMIVFSSTDEVQHMMWHTWDPAHTAYNKILDVRERSFLSDTYKEVDSLLGELLKVFSGPDSIIFVVSDHGFESANNIFFANRLLADWGYLQPGTTDSNDPLAFTSNYVPRLLRFVPDKTRAFNELSILGSFAGIHINTKDRSPRGTVEPGREYRNLCAELIKRFSDWVDPVTGLKPVVSARHRDDLYTGAYASGAPDLLIECRDCRTMPDVAHYPPLLEVRPYHISTKAQTGTHARDGIFCAAGAGLVSNASFDRFHITDVMPTVLHCFGLPVPQGLDGRVLTEIFMREFLEKNPVSHSSIETPAHSVKRKPDNHFSQQEIEEMTNRLKGLGYFI